MSGGTEKSKLEMLLLKDALDDYIEEEANAGDDYATKSTICHWIFDDKGVPPESAAGMQEMAEMFKEMSEDEIKHKGYLEKMKKIIDEIKWRV